MTSSTPREKETLLIEILLSGLDLRSTAAAVGSPMLSRLSDLLVARAREELGMIADIDQAPAADPDEP